MCFSCKKKSENEAPCFWSLVGLVWSKPARPTRLRKASCLLPALRPKGKFYFLILFFVLCGIWKSVKRQCSVWIKNLFFELFPMICIFSWWIKSLIPKIFWHGSRMTMRKIEVLLLAKVELIVYLFISMNQSYSCFGSTFFDVDCGQVRSLGPVGFLVQNTTMFRKWMHHTIMEIDP